MTDANSISLAKIVAETAARHLDDIEAAVDAAVAVARRKPWFSGMVADLVREAIRHQIHDYRHSLATAVRRNAGMYGGPAKVSSGEACRIAETLFDYPIDGRTLGSILGSELAGIASAESGRARGHQFNSRLCSKLAEIVPADKTVRECVPTKTLQRIFDSGEGPHETDAL